VILNLQIDLRGSKMAKGTVADCGGIKLPRKDGKKTKPKKDKK